MRWCDWVKTSIRPLELKVKIPQSDLIIIIRALQQRKNKRLSDFFKNIIETVDDATGIKTNFEATICKKMKTQHKIERKYNE